MGLRPKPRGGFPARRFLGAPAPAPRWGSAPDPRWGLRPPDPLVNGVWGGATTGSGAELGAAPPATLLRRSRPRVWGGAPNDSIKPTETKPVA